MPYTNLRDAREKVRRIEHFTGNTIHAIKYPGGIKHQPHWGMASNGPEAGAVYIVYSYATPIAWIDHMGRAHVTTERFSNTTSGKHMPVARSIRDLQPDERNKLIPAFVIHEVPF